jgi:D-inositol-3-phosphate glycosyltransferase
MKNKLKKILIISGTYPTTMSPQLGSFVKESVDTLKEISNIKFQLAVSKTLPFNHLMVFLKYIKILFHSFYICLSHRPQFIIAHTLFPAGLFSLFLSKIFNIKLVVFAHGGDIMGLSKTAAILWEKEKMNTLWKIRKYLINLVVQKSNGIIYVSNYLYEISKKYFNAKKNKSLVSPIGYNQNLFFNKTKFENKDKTILYVGRIDSKKGIFKFFSILSTLSNYLNENNYLVKVIGRVDDPLFFDTFNKYKKEYNVEYIGEKNRTELGDYFNSAILTIVPSFYEAFGLVAVESLACGTPVACFPVGGFSDYMEDNYNGIFLNQSDDVKSGEKILNYLQNEELMKECSQNSPASVEKYNIIYTHEKNLEFINNVYNKTSEIQ